MRAAAPPAGATGMPNLIVIGSAKSATTSLHHYLGVHPEISMATPRGTGHLVDNDAGGKEMRFFWRRDWRRRLDWYSSHFEPMTTPVRGEVTPAYSAHPFHPGVAERIHLVAPDARLVYLVRDPVDRIVAHYVQQRVDGDRRSFEERMRECEDPANPIVCPSRYATQVEQYLAHFPEEQLLVVDQHRLRVQRRETMARVYAFLGVGDDFWSPELDEERNTRQDKYALTRLGEKAFRIADPAGSRLMPRRWAGGTRSRVRRALSEKIVERPVVEGATRERLAAMLQPEVDRLRRLTGERFEAWSL